MKHFDLFSIFTGILGTFFAVILIDSTQLRIIISMGILVILLIIKIILMSIDNKKLNEKYLELTKKHQELSRQYSYKKKKLDNTEFFWNCLNNAFLNALQTSEEERFEQAYKLYLNYNSIKNYYEEEE